VALALYLDDCAFSHPLRALLIAAGHQVTVPVNAGLTGRDDDEHFAYAVEHGLLVLTKNPGDFLDLHDAWRAAGRDHPGIFLVYQDNDASRDMSDPDIVKAVANVEEVHGAGGLANQVFTLNQYRW
jgi:hypothetical protein